MNPLCSVPVLIRALIFLLFFILPHVPTHRSSYITSNIHSFTLTYSFSLPLPLSLSHTHTPYGQMSDSCKTRCKVVGECAAENDDDDDGLCLQEQHRAPSLCVCVCTGVRGHYVSVCKLACYSVRVSVCHSAL